jgi:iron complex outermembrane receptor protein
LLKHTWLRASYGQGYRFPSVAEKYISTNVEGLKIFPNTGLQPETGWSAEAGAKQEFNLLGIRGYVDVAGFVQQYKNMMEFTFDYYLADSIQYPTITQILESFGAKSQNVGRTQITGTEITIAAEKKLGNFRITVLGGYTYIKPMELDYDSTKSKGTYNNPDTITDYAHLFNKQKRKVSANELKYRYDQTAKCDLQIDYKKFSIGFSMRYNSFMKNIDRSFQDELLKDKFPKSHSNLYILRGLKEYREEHNTSDVVYDARVSYWISKNVKISVVVNNIFNREYMGRPGDVQPPRNYAFALTAKL